MTDDRSACLARELPLSGFSIDVSSPDWEYVWLVSVGSEHREDLVDLLTDDPQMSWPGIAWDRENVEYLLQLRRQHYEAHGFGVMAIESDEGEVLGMAGLQYEDETRSDVEVIAYIGRTYWGRGLATDIWRFFCRTAMEGCGLRRVVASTRPHNERAAGVLQRLGFEQDDRVTHYGQEAIRWKLVDTEKREGNG